MNEKTNKKGFGAWFRDNWKNNALFSTGIALIVMVILQTLALGFDYASFGEWFGAWINNWMNILRNNSSVGIIALGMTFVIISGGIDLAVGSTLVAVGAITMPLIDAANGVLDRATRERVSALREREGFQGDLAALSHDIRTPLAGARGYLQLANGENDAQTREHHLAAAMERIDSTTGLLDALFAYTRSADPDLSLEHATVSARSSATTPPLRSLVGNPTLPAPTAPPLLGRMPMPSPALCTTCW